MTQEPEERARSVRPRPSSASVSLRMSRLRRKDTAAELALRSELHRRGMRYRVNQPVPGIRRRTIDVAFTRRRLAVFVDGCFWHGCPEHGTRPKSNAEWWEAKIIANRARDEATSEHLRDLGWQVLRVWEHIDPFEAADLVADRYRAIAGRPSST